MLEGFTLLHIDCTIYSRSNPWEDMQSGTKHNDVHLESTNTILKTLLQIINWPQGLHPSLSLWSFFFSPSLPLLWAFWQQALAQLLWVTICYPQWKSEAFIQKVATLDLWPWCLPPCWSTPFSVSMELNSQVEKWEQAESIAIHRPSHCPLPPIPPLKKRERERWMKLIHQ